MYPSEPHRLWQAAPRPRPPTMIPLPSHRLKQWGQLGEILGGVRFPECDASRSPVVRPWLREVVSNGSRKKKASKHNQGAALSERPLSKNFLLCVSFDSNSAETVVLCVAVKRHERREKNAILHRRYSHSRYSLPVLRLFQLRTALYEGGLSFSVLC